VYGEVVMRLGAEGEDVACTVVTGSKPVLAKWMVTKWLRGTERKVEVSRVRRLRDRDRHLSMVVWPEVAA